MTPEMNIIVNVQLRPALQSEVQVVLAPQSDDPDEARFVETRVVPISTSSISPGLSVILPR